MFTFRFLGELLGLKMILPNINCDSIVLALTDFFIAVLPPFLPLYYYHLDRVNNLDSLYQNELGLAWICVWTLAGINCELLNVWWLHEFLYIVCSTETILTYLAHFGPTLTKRPIHIFYSITIIILCEVSNFVSFLLLLKIMSHHWTIIDFSFISIGILCMMISSFEHLFMIYHTFRGVSMFCLISNFGNE